MMAQIQEALKQGVKDVDQAGEAEATRLPPGLGKPPEDPRVKAAQDALEKQARRVLKEKPVVVRDMPGVEKMSEVLEEFARPMLKESDGLEDYEKALTLAAVAWNLALMSEEAQGELLEKGDTGTALGPDGLACMRIMIERKLRLFAHITRPILDFKVTDLGESYYLDVMSGLPMSQRKGAR